MGGGLMQLVAYGAQDIYLTGNPQITFFKVVYRRHTNFSMETIEQTINGVPANSGNSTVTISRNGDLVHKVYVTLIGTSVTKGSAIVSEVELEIGGQRIDKQYEEWNNIWNELSTPESKAIGLKAMQCDVGTGVTTGVGNVQVPLNFWFCRNPGLALPLIALQYHEVKLKFKWGSGYGGSGVTNAKVFCDYIYLDTDERRRFAQVSHEYLIEQIQKESLTNTSGNHKLNFNHPVKELIWTSSTDYTDAKLVLNGHDRFSKQETEYFQLRQPFDYHTAVPKQNLPSAAGLRNLESNSLTNIQTKQVASINFAKSTEDVTEPTPAELVVSTVSSGTVTSGELGTSVTFDDCGASDGSDVVTYTFLNTDLGGLSSLSVGDTVLIQMTGVGSLAASATGSSSIVTKVRSKTTGAGKFTNLDTTSCVVLQFDALLLSTARAGADIDANEFKFQSIVKLADAGCRTSQMTDKINVYSFALKPEEHQPSGTCNFSRIDNAQLHFTAAQGAGNIYAVNYNVLRIMSGMGGLAYSN
jgi:hypothetical protein